MRVKEEQGETFDGGSHRGFPLDLRLCGCLSSGVALVDSVPPPQPSAQWKTGPCGQGGHGGQRRLPVGGVEVGGEVHPGTV